MYSNKNVLVIGYGKTGQSLANFLKNHNANVIVYDDYKHLDNYKNYTEEDLNSLDFAILSPGFDLSHSIFEKLKAKKINVVSELDFISSHTSNYIVAITGTNGKTTTVNLLYEILKTAKKKCELCGNVGIPIIDKISNDKKRILVAEISSFQLESSLIFKPNIACILNIFPDHIIRHKTFENYKNIKLNINKNQNKNNYLILNKNININNYKINSKLFYFDKNNNKSFNIKNNYIYFKNKKIININEIKLKGEKNLENILAVLEICRILKVKNKYICQTLKTFNPLKHRQEVVLIKNNITYVNDSKATNVSSTLSAIQNFKNIILLLGGSDKGYEYDEIFKNNDVKRFIVFGEVKDKLKISAAKFDKQVDVFDTMEEGVLFASKIATAEDTVLLSPASASFDEFTSYKERGDKFAQIVKNL